MSFQLSLKKKILAPALTALMVFAAPVAAQNAADIPKVKNGGQCGKQRNGSDKCDVSGADYSDQTINGWYYHLTAVRANFSRARMGPGSFGDGNLAGADFSYANIAGLDLSDTNLTGAKFIGARLSNSNLERANLTNATLKGAVIIDWERYVLPYVKLCNTTLPDGSKSNRDC